MRWCTRAITRCRTTTSRFAARRSRSVGDVAHWLDARTPLRALNAVAALIVSEDGRYLVQHRDDKPEIWFPGHWGLFGGAVEPDESPEEALRRELSEELGIELGGFSLFTSFEFNLRPLGDSKVYRDYFECAAETAA